MDNKVVTYVYHDMTMTNDVVKNLREMNRRMTRINRCLAALTMMSTVYVAAMKLRCEIQRVKIYKMSKDIEELKKTEGE